MLNLFSEGVSVSEDVTACTTCWLLHCSVHLLVSVGWDAGQHRGHPGCVFLCSWPQAGLGSGAFFLLLSWGGQGA